MYYILLTYSTYILITYCLDRFFPSYLDLYNSFSLGYLPIGNILYSIYQKILIN